MEILIIDDDRVLALMVSRNLMEKGFRVTMAFDAMQATAAVMRKAPDAIILDIGLPGGTGIQVLERIRTSTKTGPVPVVILTSSKDPQIREKVMGLGANSFMEKPVDFNALYGELCRLTNKQQEGA